MGPVQGSNAAGAGPGSSSGGGNGTTSSGISTSAGTAAGPEVHHIVERCQEGKSGFSKEQIEAESNKIILPYDVHRKLSGYYSSKPKEYEGLRVRDWLAGKSFEFQTQFGRDKEFGGPAW